VDETESTDKGCSKCGSVPLGPGGVLCTSCRNFLEGRTAREIYAGLPH
jgi:hypothetical protein